MNKARLNTLIGAMTLSTSALLFLMPASANASEVSYNAAVSNMYLWRGVNLSTPSPAVSGGIDYSHDSGLYLGTWTSSEGAVGGSSEFDLYGGYAASFGDFGIDIGYAAYLYPDVNGQKFSSDDASLLTEYVLGLSYSDVSATAYLNTKELSDMYVSLDYAMGKFGLHAGSYQFKATGNNYTDFNISYSATDALTFTVSKAQGDGVKGKENPMLQVSYDLPI